MAHAAGLAFADGGAARAAAGRAARWPSCAPCWRAAAGAGATALALLCAAAGWARRGFRCDARLTVAQLCRQPARRRARRPDRPAVRRRAQHAGARRPARACSCACCATRCSPGRARPTCCCRGSTWARCWPDAAASLAEPRPARDLRRGRRVGATATPHGARLAGRRRALRRRRAGRQRRRSGAPGRATRARLGRARAHALRHEPITTVVLRSEGSALAAADARAAPRRRGAGAVRVRPRAACAASTARSPS